MALRTSRNPLQYCAADSQIQDYLDGNGQDRPGNVETLAVGTDLPPSKLGLFPIHIYHVCLVISRNDPMLPALKHESRYRRGVPSAFGGSKFEANGLGRGFGRFAPCC